MKNDSNAVIRFAVQNYFGGKMPKAAIATGYTHAQIKNWVDDVVVARVSTARYVMAVALIPEFQVVCEHAQYDCNESLSPQLNVMLNGHADHPGVYAFYDSFCNLIYIGKANASLKKEITSAIAREVDLPFPKTAVVPDNRKSVVRYISAYDVGGMDHSDYPRHVESLILRLNKPLLNKQVGKLTKILPKMPEL